MSVFEAKQALSQWEGQMAEKLNAIPYPEQEAGAEFDAKAFNLALVSILKAMHEGTFKDNIVQVTQDAFAVMLQQWGAKVPKPRLSTSLTGQLVCATIHGLTDGKLKNDPLLLSADAISKASQTEGEEIVPAQAQFVADCLKTEEEPFSVRWLADASRLVKQLQESNVSERGQAKYFLAPVKYKGLPKAQGLKEQFNLDKIIEDFDTVVFESDPACEGMNREEGMRVMCLKILNGTPFRSMNETMAATTTSFAQDGFRPGTVEELLHFAPLDPEISRKHATMAPGSQMKRGEYAFAPLVTGEIGYREFRVRPVGAGDANPANQALYIAR